jgi:hypothetical protein
MATGNDRITCKNTVDNPSLWHPFPLFSPIMEDGTQPTVFIYPTFGGRSAIPVVKTIITEYVPLDTLWDAHDLRGICDDPQRLELKLVDHLVVWETLIQYLATKTFSTVNEMLGILVLHRTIVRTLGYYLMIGDVYADDSLSRWSWGYCTEEFWKWNDRLKKQMSSNADNEQLWTKAIRIGGYDPRLLFHTKKFS